MENKEARTTDNCVFDLVGVVVHAGRQLEAGHYYSFIKDRSAVDDESWWRFDDTSVSEFDISQLGEETFGGNHEWLPREERETWQNKNAYMLFYEQRKLGDRDRTSLAHVDVPKPLSEAIVHDNQQLLRERMRSDPLVFDFIKSVLEGLTFTPVLDLNGAAFALSVAWMYRGIDWIQFSAN